MATVLKGTERWASFAILETSETSEDHDEIQGNGRTLGSRSGRPRAFDTADDIRDQFLHQHIVLDDQNRQWSVGDAGLEDAIYVRRGGGSTISEEEDFSVCVSFDYNIVILIIIRIRIN